MSLAPLPREVLEGLLDELEALVVVLDAEGRILHLNGTCARATGWTDEEARGRSFLELLVPPAEAGEVAGALERLGRGEPAGSREAGWSSKAGPALPLAWWGRRLEVPGAEPLLVLTATESCEPRRRSAEQRQTRALLEAQLAAYRARAETLEERYERELTERRRAEAMEAEAAEKYRSLFALANDGIVVLDGEGRILECNDKAVEIFARPRERIVGGTPADLSPPLQPDGRSSQEHAEQRFREAESPIIYEWLASRGDGSLFEVEVSLRRLTLTGEARMLAVVRDISERKQTERRLREGREKYYALFDNAVAGIARVRISDMVIDEVNERAVKLLGLRRKEDVVGLPFSALYADPDVYAQSMAAIFAQGESQEESRFVRPNGEVVWTFAVHRLSPDGHIDSVAVDTSELHETIERLSAAKEVAERAERARSEFLDIASHELRTPLTAMRLLLQSTLRRAGAGKQIEPAVLDRLLLQTGRLTQLVDDLLDASRLERGALSMRPEPFELGRLVATTLAEFREKSPGRPIRLEASGEPLEVVGDPLRIEQVLSNLVENALKYSPEPTPVEVRLSRAPDRVRVEVVDHGPGLSRSEQDHLFTRFYRARTETTVRQPGLGLGLYIARQIMVMHHGAIGFESTPGVGSTFYFELPLGDGLPAGLDRRGGGDEGPSPTPGC